MLMNNLEILKDVLLSNSIESNEQILFDIIPELRNEKNFEQNSPWHDKDVWRHTLSVINACDKNFYDRLTLLLHDIGKPYSYQDDNKNIRHFHNHAHISSEMAKTILNDLNIDENDINEIIWLIDNHASKINIDDVLDEEIDTYLHLLKIQICDANGYEINHSKQMLHDLLTKEEILLNRKKKNTNGR